jgi:ribosome recycling factor
VDLSPERLNEATDAELVSAAADAARDANIGRMSPAVTSLLRAIASTRSEKRRRELAQQARQRAEQRYGALTSAALTLLRVGIFALGA